MSKVKGFYPVNASPEYGMNDGRNKFVNSKQNGTSEMQKMLPGSDGAGAKVFKSRFPQAPGGGKMSQPAPSKPVVNNGLSNAAPVNSNSLQKANKHSESLHPRLPKGMNKKNIGKSY